MIIHRSKRTWQHWLWAALPAALALGCGPEEEDVNAQVPLGTQSSALAPAASGDVLSFDQASAWTARPGSVSGTSVRSEGKGALALKAQGATSVLTSAPVSSRAPQLANLSQGVDIAIDLQLPTDQPNPWWLGSLELMVSVPSRDVYGAHCGIQELNDQRLGMYQTRRFRLPDWVAAKLQGQSYEDLTFQVRLHLPAGARGTYLLDNLRVRDNRGPSNPAEVVPGTSITLRARKSYDGTPDEVASETLGAEVVQVPQSFKVMEGGAGEGTLSFEITRAGGGVTSCTYRGQRTSNTFELASCSGGELAGDLLAADRLKLAVQSGDVALGPTKVRAQLPIDALGDDVGGGLAPIPTYWGTSAAELVAALDASVRTQFEKPGRGRIHMPTPEIPTYASARVNGVPVESDPDDFDPPFNADGALTHNDLADARWWVDGSLQTPNVDTGRLRGEFSVRAGVDVWLLTYQKSLVGLRGKVTTDGGSVEARQRARYDAEFCYSVFGAEQCEYYNGEADGAVDPSINVDLFQYNDTVQLFNLPFWVFNVRGSAGLGISGHANATFSSEGFQLGFTPSANVFVRADGGVSAGPFGGGGLYASIDLLHLSAPLNAGVNLSYNLDPKVCKLFVTETFDSRVDLSVGAGSIGWYLEGGVSCGFWDGGCWREEGTLIPWDALYHDTITLVPQSPLAASEIGLEGLCEADVIAVIDRPVQHDGFIAGQTVTVRGSATAQYDESGVFLNIPRPIDCSALSWSSSNASDTFVQKAGTCETQLTFASAGDRTIKLSVQDGPVTGSRTVVLHVDPAGEAPVVTIDGDNFTPDCASSAPLSARGFDPQGQALVYEWYDETGKLIGTGASIDAPLPGGHSWERDVDVVARDPDGNEGRATLHLEGYCVT
jgi:hypothetical protein